MTRSVTALYDSRAEAELARARLSAQVDAQRVQILGRHDGAALDQVDMPATATRSYREALEGGSFLLVADVAGGEDAERIVALLKAAAVDDSASVDARPTGTTGNIWIGKREIVRGGARVRSLAGEHPVHDDKAREEHLQAGMGLGGRQLDLRDVEAAGLLKNRVIEISAMREELVIAKQAVIYEEIVLKKTTTERIETIRETVRRTEVDVQDLPRAGGRTRL